MVKSFEQNIQEIMGSLIFQIAQLTTTNQALTEMVERFQSEQKAAKVLPFKGKEIIVPASENE